MSRAMIMVLVFWSVVALVAVSSLAAEAERSAYFGDLHVHTRLSFDAFVFGTRTTPDDAYRFARGEPIEHALGYEVQLDRPLDFYAVTDHAFFLGMLEAMANPEHPLSKLERAKDYTDTPTLADRLRAFRGGAYLIQHRDPGVLRSAWQRIIEAAERHYEPGTLTTFIAYEYTSSRDGNLHRNVIFRDSSAPDAPFSRLDSLNPEKLWAWLDDLRSRGIEGLAIPHNSNGSNGQMFELQTFDGEELDAAWAETRMRNEPLVEVTQIKGTSDTHPFLSPNDEWSDFEIFPYRIASWLKSRPRGSYVREAYLNGLVLEEQRGFNPYRFGLVGATDTHNSGSTLDESKFVGKVGVLDGSDQRLGAVPYESDSEMPVYPEIYYRFWGASGLTGVWAEENTRESIYDAFRRKETFATSGPRIQVRFFAGYDFSSDLVERADMLETAYAGGVAMGGDLVAQSGARPAFLVWAMKDPLGTPLQRVQVIKGWVEHGSAREQVYDVACSDGLEVDAETHRCPDNGARVDVDTCAITEDAGDAELLTLWRDPDFDPARRAVYYARVLENPTCRWSTWAAVRADTAPRPDLLTTIQERAWSSPIWYVPWPR